MSDEQPTLLDADAAEEAPSTGPKGDQVVVFATNRQNLLQVMSSGLLTPREGYGKYYEDLMQFSPGRLPLLRTPVGPAVVALVSPPADDTSFPVLVEIDPEWLGTEAWPALTPSGDEAELTAGTDWIALAYAGVLPREALRAIHFRSERDLEEHSLREYANVDNSTWDQRVSPEHFTEADSVDPSTWLTGLPVHPFDAQAYRDADAVTGAIAAAAAATPGSEPAFARVAAMLNGRDPGKSAGLLRLGLLSPRSTTKPSGADEVLFRASALELAELDPDAAWSPAAILEAVRRRTSTFKLSKRDQSAVSGALDSVSDVVGLRSDFEPFVAGGLDSAKALQLVLLRPDPDRLLAWDSSETGATPEVMMPAAALAGLALGRIKLPSSLRPPALDRRLALLASQPGTAAGQPERPGAALTVESDDDHIWIVSVGETLIEAALTPPSLVDRLSELDSGDPRWRSVTKLLIEQMGWLDCRTVSVTIPATNADGITVATDDGGITFVFSSVVSAKTVVDRARVLARLAETDLPDAVRSEIEALL